MKLSSKVLLLGAAVAAMVALANTAIAQTATPVSLQRTLRASRWKKRVLLIAAPTTQQADFQKQKALLADKSQDLAERDFLVIELLYDQISTADHQFLIQKTGVQPPAFAAVLIGKDGGVKEKSARPIAPEALFGTVDKMPMRRAEMKRAR
jgi:hypothetical protein